MTQLLFLMMTQLVDDDSIVPLDDDSIVVFDDNSTVVCDDCIVDANFLFRFILNFFSTLHTKEETI